MKTHTVTVNEGEWLDVPFEQWRQLQEQLTLSPSSGGPVTSERQWTLIEAIRQPHPEGAVGWAVQGSYSDTVQLLYRVGVYDGWVFWRPRVCLLVSGTLGSEKVEAYNLTRAWVALPCACEGGHHSFLCRRFRVGGEVAA